MNVHNILQVALTPKKQICLVQRKEHTCSCSETGVTTASSAFLGHSFGHLHLSWRNSSSLVLCSAGSFSFSDVCSNVPSLIRSLLSAVVLALPLSPRPTPLSYCLTDNDFEGKERSERRVTGRGITRLIICRLGLPLECDLHGRTDLYFLIQCGIHLQQCLAHKNCAVIAVVIFNFIIRDALCSPTSQNSTVHGLLFCHRVDSKPCSNIQCLRVQTIVLLGLVN